jgi:hypothetical protein
VLAYYIGPHKILGATDYPHPDGFFPGAPDMVRERLKGTSPETHAAFSPAARWVSTASTEFADLTREELPMALYELRTYTLRVGAMAEAVKLY